MRAVRRSLPRTGCENPGTTAQTAPQHGSRIVSSRCGRDSLSTRSETSRVCRAIPTLDSRPESLHRGRSRATGDAMKVYDKLFINGDWVSPAGKGSIDVINSATEAVMGRIPEGSRRRHRPRGQGRARRVRGVVGDAARGARRVPGQDLRRSGRARRRAREADRRRSRHAAAAQQDDPGRSADRELRHLRQARRRVPVRGAGRQLDRGARAGRRRRLHHAVELPAAPDRVQGRAGARGGLHGRAQAERGRAAQRVLARRGDPAGRPAAGRVQPGHRLRAGRRRSARRASRGRHGVVHRLDARRASA